MTYGESFVRGIKVWILDEQAMDDLAHDPDATKHGFGTLALTGLAMGVLMALFTMLIGLATGAANTVLIGLLAGLISILIYPFAMIIGFIIGYSIYHFMARFFFGGQASGAEYFRALANAMHVSVLAVIPVVNWFINIWAIVVNIFVLKKVHKLSTWKAVLCGLLPIIIVIIIVVVIFFYALSNITF